MNMKGFALFFTQLKPLPSDGSKLRNRNTNIEWFILLCCMAIQHMWKTESCSGRVVVNVRAMHIEFAHCLEKYVFSVQATSARYVVL